MRRKTQSHPGVKITITGLSKYAQWYNSGMNIMEVTNHFKVGFKARSTR